MSASAHGVRLQGPHPHALRHAVAAALVVAVLALAAVATLSRSSEEPSGSANPAVGRADTRWVVKQAVAAGRTGRPFELSTVEGRWQAKESFGQYR